MDIKAGEIWFADFGEPYGSEQGGNRPVIIVKSDLISAPEKASVIPITSKKKRKLPMHVGIPKEFGLKLDSTALAEQMRPIDKRNLINKLGQLTDEKMKEIEYAMLSVCYTQDELKNEDFINRLKEEAKKYV